MKKNSLSTNNFPNITKLNVIIPNLLPESKLGDYLAGIIEGDGSIIVPTQLRNEQGKLKYPIIKIVFDSNALPLARKLVEILGNGRLNKPNNGNYYVLQIQDLSTIFKIISLINGRMHTPKIEALHRIIIWFNNRNYNNQQIPLYGLNTKPLNETAWLSGFMEADSNFHFEYNLNATGMCIKIKHYMRLTQRKN